MFIWSYNLTLKVVFIFQSFFVLSVIQNVPFIHFFLDLRLQFGSTISFWFLYSTISTKSVPGTLLRLINGEKRMETNQVLIDMKHWRSDLFLTDNFLTKKIK